MYFGTLTALVLAASSVVTALPPLARTVATSIKDQREFVRCIESDVERGFLARFSNDTIANEIQDFDNQTSFLAHAVEGGKVHYIASVLEHEMVILHAARSAAKAGREAPKELMPILVEIQALLHDDKILGTEAGLNRRKIPPSFPTGMVGGLVATLVGVGLFIFGI
ncbi:hypothetical protein EV356DRAFT_317309 [Viridothelium virens]|uniref:Uncharacterized protein n=1 Tax=Viridothelium virens TaxID=1048519 RepID=A0A6A6GZB0_VIRVR|nr:hypothetical protein EV356DRAFT_317309 [Viridothelium virens]